eukprot:m.28496 g.28496  ORF g.28496 m.28496 type:complete len:247 (-) comp11846_c0_seq1:91-831(-)
MSVEYLKSYFEAAESVPLEMQRIITNIRQSDHDLNERIIRSQKAVDAAIAAIKAGPEGEKAQAIVGLKDSLAQMLRIQEIKAEFGSEIREIVKAKQAQLAELQGDFVSGNYLKREQEAAAAQRQAERRARSDNARRKRQQQEIQSEDFEDFEDDDEPEVMPTSKRAKAREQPPEPEEEPEVEESDEARDSYCVRGCTVKDADEMVGCDNEESCIGQWFHYSCVGLRGPPTTKTWYCPECTRKMKRK